MKLLKTIFIIITAIATLIGAGFAGSRRTRTVIDAVAATDSKKSTVRAIRKKKMFYEPVSETETESAVETTNEITTETEAYESVEQKTTKAKATTTKPAVTHAAKKYDGNISEDEYEFICTIVMAEAGAEPYEGIIAVTQCYLNAMKKENADAYTIHNMYGYAKGKTPDRNIRTIVYDVLYNGLSVTDEPILYFYAPALTYSAWHESQIFVMEIGGHRFFKERV